MSICESSICEFPLNSTYKANRPNNGDVQIIILNTEQDIEVSLSTEMEIELTLIRSL